MLDFTNTPERRRRAAQARNRKMMICLGLGVLIPAAAMAFDLQSLGLFSVG